MKLEIRILLQQWLVGVVASRHPEMLSEEWVNIIKQENHLKFAPVAEQLAAARSESSSNVHLRERQIENE